MNPLLLEIAGLRVRIDGLTEDLHAVLTVRFRDFLKEDGRGAFTVHIHHDLESPAFTHASPGFTFDEGRVFFDLPGYVGFIDPARAAGLRIASNTPAVGVDYFLRIVIALLAYQAGGLMVHGAGIVRGDRAFLFFGRSGSGKSTVARNSPADLVLNDDLVVLVPGNGGWCAHGTPFTNPTQTPPSPDSAPLSALLQLVHSPRVYAIPLRGGQAVAALLASVPVLNSSPAPPFDRCRDILATVPAYTLHLLPDASFWPVVEAL